MAVRGDTAFARSAIREAHAACRPVCGGASSHGWRAMERTPSPSLLPPCDIAFYRLPCRKRGGHRFGLNRRSVTGAHASGPHAEPTPYTEHQSVGRAVGGCSMGNSFFSHIYVLPDASPPCVPGKITLKNLKRVAKELGETMARPCCAPGPVSPPPHIKPTPARCVGGPCGLVEPRPLTD